MKKIVGYGSLMDKDSFSKTLPLRDMKPVWIEGFKRVFNLKPSRPYIYKEGGKGIAIAVANLEESEKSRCNGLMFEVTESELEKLKIRERSYRLKEVEVSDFETEDLIGTAYVFIGSKRFRDELIISDEFEPLPSYLEKVRKASYNISEDFGISFDTTTFKANGERI
jgi:cation transport regulator ChaC